MGFPLEALKSACQIVGTSPYDSLNVIPYSTFDSDNSDACDDLENIQSMLDKYSLPSPHQSEPLSLQPLKTLPPASSDNNEDDFETLHAIERRCAAYESNALGNTNAKLDQLELPESSSTANFFVDAIRKNRVYQQAVRNKMVKIEALIEENKEHKKRVKILREFQISCKKRTGNALSQKKDPRVQLISLPRSRRSKVSKTNGIKAKGALLGPDENSHVRNYRMVLERFPISLHRENWSEKEKENLRKGIKQQFQEALLEKTMELHCVEEEGVMEVNTLDDAIAPISNFELIAENVRAFVPKVNWERLASMYVEGRSGEECEARWLNSEDPLINCNQWTKDEDKKLLYVVQKRGLFNWIEIATMLGTNRTPFQCVARYQRSLNTQIIKQEWAEEEDTRLCAAVEVFGDNNWQPIAACLEGRTGQQCSNRWQNTLNPARKKVGRWDVEEDKHLKVAVTLFGSRAWSKIAQFVPGRTQVQCRERWLNVLDPTLNLEPWTEEEDSKLLAAIKEYGNCWSKIAAYVPPRTDNQCRRRWKVLRPHEVPLRQAAFKIHKSCLKSNFVDRKIDRPELGASDFIPPPASGAVLGAESGSSIKNEKKKTLKRCKSGRQTDVASSVVVSKRHNTKRSKTKSQIVRDEEENGELESFKVG